MNGNQRRTIAGRIGFGAWAFVATFISFLIHEQAHYWAGTILGFDMWFNLNSTGNYNDVQPNPLQRTVITMAGPIITVLQAFIAALLIKSSKDLWIYAFVIAAFWQRAYAFATTMAISLNDEGRIAVMYDLPTWSIHSLTSGALLAITIWAAVKARAGFITNIIAWFAVSLTMAAVVLGTQAYPVKFG